MSLEDLDHQKIQVRHFEAGDLQAVFELYAADKEFLAGQSDTLDNIENYTKMLKKLGVLDQDGSTENLPKDDKEKRMWVLVYDGKIIGSRMYLYRPINQKGEVANYPHVIGGMVIDKEFRRKGCATFFAEATHKELKELGIKQLYTQVFPKNEGSLELMRKLGYRNLGDALSATDAKVVGFTKDL